MISQQIVQAWTERDSSLNPQLSTDKRKVGRESYSVTEMNHVLWESMDDSEAKAKSPRVELRVMKNYSQGL